MTPIAPLSPASTYQPAAMRGSSSAAPGPAAAAPSGTVALGRQGAAIGLYSPSGLLVGAKQPVWENHRVDTVSALMADTVTGGDLAARLSGLGRALLDHVSEGGNGYSQSVLWSDQAMQGDAGVQSILRDQLQRFATDNIGLSVTTAGGAKVNFTLAANSDGIAAKIEVAQGTLSAADRESLRKLGDAFQAAIDGLAQQPPKLALDGLMKFDAQALAGVDLNARLGDQNIEFHVDARQRTLSTSGAAGSVKVAVDLKNTAILGGDAQRQQAISSYLRQFDAASRRGHGDAGLTALFKDAFAQLNGNAPSHADAPGKPLAAVGADAMDRKMLTGLADFTASISQAIATPNPLKHDEVDNFDYRVSQQTTVSGRSQANRDIVQQQQSSLHAAYHESVPAGLPLKLGTDAQSQNYTYHQIEDQASSKLEIAYDKGYLSKALLSQTASQDTRVTKYLQGKVVSDTRTPLQAAIVRDFAAQLQDGKDSRDANGEYLWQQKLARIGAMALLQPDPAALKAQGAQTLLD